MESMWLPNANVSHRAVTSLQSGKYEVAQSTIPSRFTLGRLDNAGKLVRSLSLTDLVSPICPIALS